VSALESAFQAHNAGRLAEAEKGYRAVLKSDPRQADAWHLLGIAVQQQGRLAEAEGHVQSALRLGGPKAEYLASLGNVLSGLGRYPEAIDAYRRSVALRPGNAPVHNSMGNAFQGLGQLVEAAACYRRAIAHQPSHFLAHYNLGRVLTDSESSAAADSFRKAIALKPDFAEALTAFGMLSRRVGDNAAAIENLAAAVALRPGESDIRVNLGVALIDAGRFAEAERHLREAVALNPSLAEAHYNLGNALKDQDRFDAAVPAYEAAITLNPAFVRAHVNLASILQKSGQFERALAAYDGAVGADPASAEAHNGRAAALMALGRDDEARAALQTSQGLAPDFADAHSNAALLSLASGDFAAGWSAYEWRWPSDGSGRRAFEYQPWAGESEGAILVWGEQGIGDRILYAGMVPDLRARGQDVVIETDARLVALFERSFPGVKAVALSDPPDAATQSADVRWHTPAGSLGRWLRSSLAWFPNRQAYLVPDANRVQRYRTLLKDGSDARVVGISWISSNPIVGRHKTMALRDLAPILSIPDLRFVDLQYGDTAAERAALEAECGVQITHIPDLDLHQDIDGVAALAAACDLVISVSNTTVHLSAAVGTPTWVLVPAAAGNLWYWMRRGAHTPWYAAVTIFRQKKLGEWTELVSDVAARLRQI
jgi:tetratricopeptide (TPR) repeat protein